MQILLCVIFLTFLSCSSKTEHLPRNQKNIAKLSDNGLNKINIKSSKKKRTKSISYKLTPTTPLKDKNYFKNVATKYGVENLDATAFYSVDFDNDKKTDLVYISNYYSKPVFLKRIKNKFVPLDYLPIHPIPKASFLNFHDIDKDGVLDLIAVTFNQHKSLKKEAIKIYKGVLKNKKLKYVLQKSGLENIKLPSSSLVLLDYDLDGNIDFFLGNWFKKGKLGKKKQPDLLFKGSGDFNFKNASYLIANEQFFSNSFQDYINATPTIGVSICDVDQNGYPDILTSNSSGYKNKLWMNLNDREHKDRKFIDIGEKSNFACDKEGDFNPLNGGNTFFSICADYNNDGIIDIAVGEVYHSYDSEQKDRSSILTGATFNYPPKFIRSPYYKDDGTGNWNEGDRRGLWLDYNNDGLKDLLVDNSGFPPNSKLILFEQEKNHAFYDIAPEVGVNLLNPIGSITLDVNNDGRQDILTGQSSLRLGSAKTKTYLFQNIKKWENKSIRFYLKGLKSNSSAIGASLYLKTSAGIYSNFIQYSFGTQPSQIEDGSWFGVPKYSRIKSVEVRWPIKVKGVPLTKTYNLRSFNFKFHVDITLCEDGRLKHGNKKCF